MKKTTIVVNDIAASPGGGLTVLKEFYDAVNRNRKDVSWVFLLSKRYLEETDNVKLVLLPNVKKHVNRIIFDSFSGAKVINSYEPSVVFSLQNTVVSHCMGRKVTYIHQPLPFQKTKQYSFLKKNEFWLACIQYLLGIKIKKGIKSSDLNIVQTKWMKNAVERLCKVTNVMQIYPNMPDIKNKAIYETTSSFFYPTGNALYKNNGLLINVCKKLLEEGVGFHAIITADQSEKIENIEFIGRISIDEVYKYYETSCLVFPSFIETFGYPLVEARAAGALILASDCEFSHELLDGYENVYFFNPFKEDELYELMKKVATGKIKRKRTKSSLNLISESSVYSNTWDQLVDEILEIALK